ncbi:MAG: ABC transporter permease [Planctomycetes bacterium]|nr:ABC transporter permease [Planctomycetota bacterium]
MSGLAAIDALGRRTCAFAAYLLDLASLVGVLIARLLRLGAVSREVLFHQIRYTGVQALPFTMLLALLTALVVVVQAQVQAAGIGDADLLGKVLVLILVREFGPLIVALVVIARSGAAIATELASMTAEREIQALAWSGIHPLDYLVVPRLAGVCISLVCLVLLFIACSLAAGFALSALLVAGAPDLGRFVDALARNLHPGDGVVLLAKTLVPGVLIAGIACREGLGCRPRVTEVPRAATRAVVRAIATVFLWDAAVTALAFAAA